MQSCDINICPYKAVWEKALQKAQNEAAMKDSGITIWKRAWTFISNEAIIHDYEFHLKNLNGTLNGDYVYQKHIKMLYKRISTPLGKKLYGR